MSKGVGVRVSPGAPLNGNWVVSSVGRASPLHGECRQFETVTTYHIWKCGRVRFIAPVLKTDESKGSVSSNLTASAKQYWRGPIMVLERIANPSLDESWVLGSSPSLSARMFDI